MADKHDEAARELLGVLEWYAPRRRLQGIYDPKYSNDVRGVASALRKAEADGLREAARVAIGVACFAEGTSDGAAYAEGFTDAQSSIAARLQRLAAEKETNG